MRRTLPFVVLLVIAGFLAGLVVTGRMRSGAESSALQRTETPRAAAPETARASTPLAAAGGLPDFSEIAARTIPAVANIASLQVVKTPASPFGNDPLFNYFFR